MTLWKGKYLVTDNQVLRVYLNGKIVDGDKAKISVFDRGFMLADGAYEVIAVYGGQMLWPDKHLERLQHSLSSLGIVNPLTPKAWLRIFEQVIEANPPSDFQGLYIQVTRGVQIPRAHTYEEDLKPTVFVKCSTAIKKSAGSGVACITMDDIRWQRCDIKSINRVANVMMSQMAKEQDAAEAILIRDGLVVEGASSNVFMVKNNVIITPAKSLDLLSGVTRDLVLMLAIEAGYTCKEQPVKVDELFDADEVWITSTTREISPLIQLDNRAVGQGIQGGVYQELIKRFHDFIAKLSDSSA